MGAGVRPRTAGIGRSRVATAGTALGLLLAGTAAVVLRIDEAPPERRWGAVSFPLAWATPALLALLARRRPVLLVPAALLATVLAFSSLSGAALLLLVPAGLWVAAAGGGRPRWPGPARTAVVLALPLGGLAAFAALLVHEDPVCWDVVRSADGDETDRVRSEPACGDDFGVGAASGTGSVVGGGGTSDVVVLGEAVVSGLLVGATLVVARAAAPVERP